MGDHVVEFTGDAQPLGRRRLGGGVLAQHGRVVAPLPDHRPCDPGEQHQQRDQRGQGQHAHGQQAGRTAAGPQFALPDRLLPDQGGGRGHGGDVAGSRRRDQGHQGVRGEHERPGLFDSRV